VTRNYCSLRDALYNTFCNNGGTHLGGNSCKVKGKGHPCTGSVQVGRPIEGVEV